MRLAVVEMQMRNPVLLAAAILAFTTSTSIVVVSGVMLWPDDGIVPEDHSAIHQLDESRRQVLGHDGSPQNERCALALGSWCGLQSQAPAVPVKPVPRGDKPCPGDCNGRGNCDYSDGLCMCDAGWSGADCLTPQRRPCTNRLRSVVPSNVTLGHIDEDGRDLNWTTTGYTLSRCAGICDDAIGACFCDGALSKHGRVAAPRGSPYGTPPLQRGRPLGDWCQPIITSVGRNNVTRRLWGQVPFDKIYGAEGWCVADKPQHSCGCGHDGLAGPTCDVPLEAFCLSQCSGHGECHLGFCRCHTGWYGTDCARQRAGRPAEASLADTTRPWIATATRRPLAARVDSAGVQGYDDTGIVSSSFTDQDSDGGLDHSSGDDDGSGGGKGEGAGGGGASMARRVAARRGGGGGGGRAAPSPAVQRRPLIYVYELPPEFNTRLLQYRMSGSACTHRLFTEAEGAANLSTPNDRHPYPLETYLHEVVLQSSHRTFDPEEADFFWVPVYACCLIFPVLLYADHPWYGAPAVLRPLQSAHLMLEAKRWLQKHHPWWDRRGGRDHIWLTTHDEGACYMPSEIYNSSVVLTQWGRRDETHASGSAYTADDYSKRVPSDMERRYFRGRDWRDIYQGHPCYNSTKDLVIPHLKWPAHYQHSPLLGAAPPERRDVLFFFRGDVGKDRAKRYSRGVRQGLYRLATTQGWRTTYNICIGDRADLPGDYSDWLRRSTFCLVAPGDGYSARAEDAILHGCIPVIIQDNVHAPLESLLDYSSFSLRVNESQLALVPQLLLAVPALRVQEMQQELMRVWHRFAYTSGRWLRTIHRDAHASNIKKSSSSSSATTSAARHPPPHWPYRQDAWHTILQWLYYRIPATR